MYHVNTFHNQAQLPLAGIFVFIVFNISIVFQYLGVLKNEML